MSAIPNRPYSSDFEATLPVTKAESNSKNTNKKPALPKLVKLSSKNGSNNSSSAKLISVPKKKTAKKSTLLSTNQSNQYEEIMRLMSETHDKDIQLKEQRAEVKTLKSIIMRQERAIKDIHKEQEDVPKLIQTLNSEIKKLKHERKHFQEKCAIAEKNAASRCEEVTRLQIQYTKIVKQVNNTDFEDRNDLLDALRKTKLKVEHLDEKVKHLEKLLYLTSHDKNSEIKDLKNRLVIAQRESGEARAKQIETSKKLQEKERALGAFEVQQHIRKDSEPTRYNKVLDPHYHAKHNNPTKKSTEIEHIRIESEVNPESELKADTDSPATIFKPTLFKRKQDKATELKEENENEFQE